MNSGFLMRGTLSPRVGLATSGTGGRNKPSTRIIKIPPTVNRVPSSIAVKKGR